jgi:hypothetical protein
MTVFSNITDADKVAIYEATNGIFDGLIGEIRELSKKKPEATLNSGKVKLINRVLIDLKSLLDKEPEGKFLDLLDDEDLPQTSDAVLVMVQFETALRAFHQRYHKSVEWDYRTTTFEWITPEVVAAYKKKKGQNR